MRPAPEPTIRLSSGGLLEHRIAWSHWDASTPDVERFGCTCGTERTRPVNNPGRCPNDPKEPTVINLADALRSSVEAAGRRRLAMDPTHTHRPVNVATMIAPRYECADCGEQLLASEVL